MRCAARTGGVVRAPSIHRCLVIGHQALSSFFPVILVIPVIHPQPGMEADVGAGWARAPLWPYQLSNPGFITAPSPSAPSRPRAACLEPAPVSSNSAMPRGGAHGASYAPGVHLTFFPSSIRGLSFSDSATTTYCQQEFTVRVTPSACARQSHGLFTACVTWSKSCR